METLKKNTENLKTLATILVNQLIDLTESKKEDKVIQGMIPQLLALIAILKERRELKKRLATLSESASE